MKRFTRIFFCLMIALSATRLGAQPANTPIEFNDNLTVITDSLYSYGQNWGRQFNEVTKARSAEKLNAVSYSSLTPHRQAMERFVTGAINRLKVTPDVENSKDLRMAMIGFLEFEKTMVTMAFKPLEQLKSSVTNAELNAAYERLGGYSKDEQVALKKVAVAQEAYAKSNGFTIESTEESEKP